jgi:hypothetical protein
MKGGADFEQCPVCNQALQASASGDGEAMQSSNCSHILHSGCWRAVLAESNVCPVCSVVVDNLHPVNQSELQVLQAMDEPSAEDVAYRVDDAGDEGEYRVVDERDPERGGGVDYVVDFENRGMEARHTGPLSSMGRLSRLSRSSALFVPLQSLRNTRPKSHRGKPKPKSKSHRGKPKPKSKSHRGKPKSKSKSNRGNKSHRAKPKSKSHRAKKSHKARR